MASSRRIFSKKLTNTDIAERMYFPTKKLNCLPRFQPGHHAVEFPVVDETGYVWYMNCTIRKQHYKKPVISKGWRNYVLSKGLQAGDVITFYRAKGEPEAAGPLYKILLTRKAVRLFGAVIGYVPIHGGAAAV